MGRRHPPLASVAARLESFLYRGGWPFRLARALGARCRGPNDPGGAGGVARSGRSPLTIGYASDFHAGGTTDPGLLAAAVAALRAAAPDVLLLGGDFVTHDAGAAGPLAAELAAIPAPLGPIRGAGQSRLVGGRRGGVADAGGGRHPRPDEPRTPGCRRPTTGSGSADSMTTGAAGRMPRRRCAAPTASGSCSCTRRRACSTSAASASRSRSAVIPTAGQVALPGGTPLIVPHGALSRRYARGQFSLESGAHAAGERRHRLRGASAPALRPARDRRLSA